jgi:serine/threonine protein kinase
MPDRIGQQLGNYQLLRLLGEGGFAEVYLGEHIHLGTQAAIKVLLTQLGRADIEQFRSEARTIAQLEHPHIVRILDFGVEGTTPFLVMSYAPGGTLRTQYPKGTRLPLGTVVSFVQQVASALQYAHDHKVIHRDIKPENLLVGRFGECLLSDFGIALISQSSRYQSTRDMAGTIAYMAPEQINAHPRPESDQYALGIVVYEWLSGDRPFHGTFTEIAVKQSIVPPPSLLEIVPTLSPAVEQVVMTALAKDPRQRFDRIQTFADVLREAALLPRTVTLSPTIEARMVASPPPSKPTTQIADVPLFIQHPTEAFQSSSQNPLRNEILPSPQKHRRVAFLLILVILVLLGGGSLGVYATATGKWTGKTSHVQPTSSLSSNRNQVTATAQASTNSLGRMWHPQTSGTSQALSGVAWSGSLFVTVGNSGTILTSPDGITWTPRTSGTPLTLISIAWSNSQFIAMGIGGVILTSPDGSTWTQETSGTSQWLDGVAWSGSRFVVVGWTGTILTSPDGSTWTQETSGTSQILDGVVWSGSQFVVVGSSGTILTSSDGITWTPRTSGTLQYLDGVVWSGSQFVAVGGISNGVILTSPDGQNWTQETSGVSLQLNDVVWSGSHFVVVGVNGTILTSLDGIAWTQETSGTSQYLGRIAWSGSRLVAVGSNGTILTSP